MSMVLLRSLLRQTITDLSGSASRAGELGGGSAMRYLIGVARKEPALYEHLRTRHRGDPRGRVAVVRRSVSDLVTTAWGLHIERRRRRSVLATAAPAALVA